MKKILSILVMFSLTMHAQLTLENIYTSPGRFILTEIAPNEFKYFSFDDPANQFKLYNLNHSLYMTVNVPLSYSFGTNTYFVSYVSRSLFDCDTTNIEYSVMYLGSGAAFPAPYFAVYRTNGTLFQKIDSVRYGNYSAASSYATYVNNGPIINTPAGAKLILVKPSGNVAIYSLCGLLPTNITKHENNQYELFNPFPNPSNYQITLPYSIPNDESGGKLTVFNSSGQTVKEFDVDNNFNSIILDKSELPPGTYFYNVKSRHNCSETQKFILTD